MASIFLGAASASAANWEYSNNGKGNHYLMASSAPFSLTFACNGKKVIGFFSAPISILEEDFKHAKFAYSIARVDGDEAGNGRYAWFGGATDADEHDINFKFESHRQIVKLLGDVGAAEYDFSVGVSLQNPAKGGFATKHSTSFDLDGAPGAIAQLFDACHLR